MLRKGLTKKVTFELKSECQERLGHKISPGGIFHTEYTSPEVWIVLASSRKGTKAKELSIKSRRWSSGKQAIRSWQKMERQIEVGSCPCVKTLSHVGLTLQGFNQGGNMIWFTIFLKDPESKLKSRFGHD